jgi:leucyl-tRNA synthetase
LREDADAKFIFRRKRKIYRLVARLKNVEIQIQCSNPDAICTEYGDTLRLYEMFLGPLEQAKPWNTAGISGVLVS